MAKDGTNRGGRRVRAGDKPQPLADKITAGKAAKILEAPELQPESMLEAEELEDATDLYGEDMPAPSDYLSARQKAAGRWRSVYRNMEMAQGPRL
ncbi:MAG: hypothetical protein PHR65_02250 [Syntrophomonadaceae bacterium]|nr:hypothetical protein [Syntrophomonadaceae bacterium]